MKLVLVEIYQSRMYFDRHDLCREKKLYGTEVGIGFLLLNDETRPKQPKYNKKGPEKQYDLLAHVSRVTHI